MPYKLPVSSSSSISPNKSPEFPSKVAGNRFLAFNHPNPAGNSSTTQTSPEIDFSNSPFSFRRPWKAKSLTMEEGTMSRIPTVVAEGEAEAEVAVGDQ
ncbi:unnamed protein product [Linum trigynum]|uniref:Uncharacterized protein n=1 Tax=Linum trigynum TaxID=586398 RepID=A0AAV2EAB2_9ROSI